MKRKRMKNGRETGINMTPVLGIALLILLFFAVTVPFGRERGIELVGESCHHCGCDLHVRIEVDRDNRIFVEEDGKQKRLALRAVKDTVARRLAEYPGCSVLVVAHRHSDMGTVVRVADQARLATDPPPDVSIATVD